MILGQKFLKENIVFLQLEVIFDGKFTFFDEKKGE